MCVCTLMGLVYVRNHVTINMKNARETEQRSDVTISTHEVHVEHLKKMCVKLLKNNAEKNKNT